MLCRGDFKSAIEGCLSSELFSEFKSQQIWTRAECCPVVLLRRHERSTLSTDGLGKVQYCILHCRESCQNYEKDAWRCKD